MKTTQIGLVTGGYSSESIVSFKSAKTVYSALKETYNAVYWIEIHPDRWFCTYNDNMYPIDKNEFSTTIDGRKITFDFIYLMVHGTPAEDGLLPAYFDLLNLPYSCCSPMASQITFDKAATIRYAKALQIPTAPSLEISKANFKQDGSPELEFTFPVFVKACRSGSSFGVVKVNEQAGVKAALKEAFKYDNVCLIEQGMQGTEVTCGLLETKNGLEIIAITEVVAHNDFFDFDAKYHGKADEITPARISKEEEERVIALSKQIYGLYDLTGVCRIDFMLVDGHPFLIEINTIPGMTTESFIPQQIRYTGKTLPQFFDEQVVFELKKYQDEKA